MLPAVKPRGPNKPAPTTALPIPKPFLSADSDVECLTCYGVSFRLGKQNKNGLIIYIRLEGIALSEPNHPYHFAR